MNIKRLIELLADGYEVENMEAIIENCEDSFNNPRDYLEKNDLLWRLDEDEETVESQLNFAIPFELMQIVIQGDKIDEIHGEIEGMKEGIPEFPYEKKFTAKEYFGWLDEILSEMNEEILEIGESLGDELMLFLVYKENTNEIMEISKKFNLKCENPKDSLY